MMGRLPPPLGRKPPPFGRFPPPPGRVIPAGSVVGRFAPPKLGRLLPPGNPGRFARCPPDRLPLGNVGPTPVAGRVVGRFAKPPPVLPPGRFRFGRPPDG